MQIASIAQQLLSPLSFDRKADSAAESDSAKPNDKARLGDSGLVGSGQFHEILSQYDVTNITPRDFSNLVQQLHEAGAIGDADMRELSKMRLQLEQSGASPDTPVNLLEFFQANLENKQRRYDDLLRQGLPDQVATLRGDDFTAEARKQLDWVRKFALVQDSGDTGVDLGA